MVDGVSLHSVGCPIIRPMSKHSSHGDNLRGPLWPLVYGCIRSGQSESWPSPKDRLGSLTRGPRFESWVRPPSFTPLRDIPSMGLIGAPLGRHQLGKHLVDPYPVLLPRNFPMRSTPPQWRPIGPIRPNPGWFNGCSRWPTLSTVWDTPRGCAIAACPRSKPRLTRRRPETSSWRSLSPRAICWR
jgi:hypothetical protein